MSKMCGHTISAPFCDICVAYKEGREARSRGERREGDPYVADMVMRKSWRSGWLAQDAIDALDKTKQVGREEGL